MIYKSIAPIFSDMPTDFKREKNPEGKIRRTRFDKLHPRKFPVSEDENIRLRFLFRKFKEEMNVETITQFITMLLRFGLRHPELLKSRDYNSTGTFKTVKPNSIEKELLCEKAIKLNTSERKYIYIVIFSVVDYLSKGGVIKSEDVQPIRPTE